MRVERFQEDDMRKAMARVRAVLGKDAVLISSRNVDKKVEVIAASDYEPEKLEAALKKLQKQKVVAMEEAPQIEHTWEVLEEVAKESEPPMQSPSLSALNDELGRLRKLFEGELAHLSWREESSREPNRQALLSRLEAGGLSQDVADRIVTRALPCKDLELAWSRVQKILSLLLKKTDEDILENGGIVAMLGSTGVGKTATAVKIAAQFALRHGRNQVAFITTDRNRVGGQAKLVSLGSALGIPVQVVASPEEVQNALECFAVRKLVIIDTEGVSQHETAIIEKFASLTQTNNAIRPYLVLSATTHEAVIKDTIDAYANVPLAGVIVTKVDESEATGAIVSSLIRSRLPIAFICNGQRIPEDLHPGSVEFFVSKIVNAHVIFNSKPVPPRYVHKPAEAVNA